MRKAIILGAIILGAVNIVLQFIHVDYQHLDDQMFLYYTKGYLSCFNLGLPGMDSSFPETINYAELFFYGLLLTSGILYAFSKKETRLLRYLFSVIFLSRCIGLLWTLFSITYNFNLYKEWQSFFFFFLSLVLIGGWLFICLKAIRFLSTAPLETVTESYMGNEVEIFTRVSRWERLVNLLADSVTLMLVFMPSIESITSLMRNSESLYALAHDEVTARLIVWLLVALLQVVYYMMFEGVFQATPGKFLSGTRVVNADGSKPPVTGILKRSLSRLVPFEPLSVLFNQSWHDNWSDTHIVNEKSEGVKGGAYFLIFPLFALLGFGGYMGYESYKDYKYKQAAQAEHEREYLKLQAALKNLTINDVIVLEDIHDTYDADDIYLKAEKISGDSITFTKMAFENHSNWPEKVVEYYAVNKDSLPKVTLSRKELGGAILKDHHSYIGYSRQSAAVPGTLDFNTYFNYYIKNISSYFSMSVSVKLMERNPVKDGQIDIVLISTVPGAKLVSFKNVKGNLILETALPADVPDDGGTYWPVTALVNDADAIEAELVFSDSNGKTQTYTLTATGDFEDAELTKKK
jgi:uncharacterized RDD family membrane protein YckC